jgi:hypothetical protein
MLRHTSAVNALTGYSLDLKPIRIVLGEHLSRGRKSPCELPISRGQVIDITAGNGLTEIKLNVFPSISQIPSNYSINLRVFLDIPFTLVRTSFRNLILYSRDAFNARFKDSCLNNNWNSRILTFPLFFTIATILTALLDDVVAIRIRIIVASDRCDDRLKIFKQIFDRIGSLVKKSVTEERRHLRADHRISVTENHLDTKYNLITCRNEI